MPDESATFDLKIVFSGLVMFVPNAYELSKAKMCALLLNGTQLEVKGENQQAQKRTPLDGRGFLRYHSAFVRFPINDLVGADPDDPAESFGIWHLDRQRLLLETFPESESSKFTILGSELEGDLEAQQPEADNFYQTVDANKIYDDYEVDPALLFPNPPEERVMAQFFISKGVLGCETLTGFVMEFDSTLSNRIYKHAFAHELSLTLTGLTKAKLKAVSLVDPDLTKELDLGLLQKDGFVEISVLNLCPDNPLQWSLDVPPVPDEDSKWYYELLSEKDKGYLKKQLADGFLPVPRPTTPEPKGGGPGSTDCIPHRTSRPIRFFVPEWDGPIPEPGDGEDKKEST